MATLNTDIRFIKGVGEARAKTLARLGITDLRSLLSYFPRAYEDRRTYKKIADLVPGEMSCVCAVVAGEAKLSSTTRSLTRSSPLRTRESFASPATTRPVRASSPISTNLTSKTHSTPVTPTFSSAAPRARPAARR